MPNGNIQDVAHAAQAINGILAPAIMISASALIILALQGKYSQLIDRLRALNDERRRMKQSPQYSEQRFANIVEQIEAILFRARLVRNSIMSLYLAIMLFVVSSIVIGVRLTLGINVPIQPSLIVFMAGMLFVLAGVLYILRDIGSAYKVAQLEVRGVKELEERTRAAVE